MRERLPKLYAIIDRTTLDARGISVGEFARELRDGGVRLVQYRDKRGSPQEILRACEEIRGAFAGADATLILNDRADLAVLAEWDGVHVGQGDLPVDAARRVLKGTRVRQTGEAQVLSRTIVGISTHTDTQVRAAMGGNGPGADPDYVAIGPVFTTSSKANPEPIVGLDGVRRARGLTSKPLVAIGGITIENAASVMEAGADCVAVIGALMPNQRSVMDLASQFVERLSHYQGNRTVSG